MSPPLMGYERHVKQLGHGMVHRRAPDGACPGPSARPAGLCDASAIVLHSLLYALARLMLEILIVRGRSKARLEAEVLALRHQLRVLERQVGRPRWQPGDRLYLAAISRVLPRPDWRSLLSNPDTLLRWHRELVRRKWVAYRRRPPYRPARGASGAGSPVWVAGHPSSIAARGGSRRRAGGDPPAARLACRTLRSRTRSW